MVLSRVKLSVERQGLNILAPMFLATCYPVAPSQSWPVCTTTASYLLLY